MDILKSKWESYILNTDKATGSSNQLKKGIKFLSDNLEKLVSGLIIVFKYITLYKVGILLANSALKTGGILNTLYNLSLTKMRGGIKATIASLRALKVATATTGIGLLLVALGGAYELWQSFKDGAKEATDDLDNFNKALEKSIGIIAENEKGILSFEKGKKQLAAAERSYFDIKDKLNNKLKEEGRSTYIVNSALKLLTSVRTDDVTAINKQIDTLATFSDSSKRAIRNAILGTQSVLKIIKDNEKFILKSDKDKELKSKAATAKQISAAKKLALELKTSAFNLAKFKLDLEIQLNDDLFKNQSESDAEREKALKVRSDKEIKLAKLTRDRKLQGVKEGTDKERLILLQFKRKEKIQGRKDNDTDGLDLELLKRNAEKQRQIKEDAMNTEIKDAKDLLKLALDNESVSLEDRKTLIEQNEIEIAGIKKKYAIEGLNSQLTALKVLIDATDENSELRAKYEAKAHDISIAINKLTTDDFIEKEGDKTEAVKVSTEEILQISQDLVNAIGELANALFDAKIQNIDLEIEKENEKYDTLIQAAGNDINQKELLEKEHEEKNTRIK